MTLFNLDAEFTAFLTGDILPRQTGYSYDVGIFAAR
jgi:hypothetical protein